jgi:hypothetical protein
LNVLVFLNVNLGMLRLVFIFCILVGAIIVSANEHELTLSTGWSIMLEDPDLDYQFKPFTSSDGGHGLQSVDFDADHGQLFALGYSYRLDGGWKLSTRFTHQKLRWQSQSIVDVQYEWSQWSPVQPFPIISVSEQFRPEQSPELSIDQASYYIGLLREFEFPRLAIRFEAGLVAQQNYDIQLGEVYFENSIELSRGILAASKQYLTFSGDNSSFGGYFALAASYPLSKRVSILASIDCVRMQEQTVELDLESLNEIEYFWHADSLESIEPLVSESTLNFDATRFQIALGLSVTFG